MELQVNFGEIIALQDGRFPTRPDGGALDWKTKQNKRNLYFDYC
jgi:hypothetical protein